MIYGGCNCGNCHITIASNGDVMLAGELLTVRLPMHMSTGLLMYGYEILNESDTIIIGAGAGLSTSAGFTYTGKRFEDNFSDFIENYGFKDMYSGGFYPFESLEEHWAYWSRYIYINRYMDVDNGTYKRLYEQELVVRCICISNKMPLHI